ncbi:MAG: glycosyltransferase family 2 protein [Pelolinea sp.]|nr:glycosyltransferase family 2 protein [Pelolinea sp.]
MNQTDFLDFIIINWNSALQLRRCVDSILSSTIQIPGKLIVVDNCSTDTSMKGLNGIKNLQIFQQSKNLGFGGGCNLGSSQSRAGFFLFLNPDIQFLPDSLKRVVDFLNSPELLPETGIIGVQLQNPDGSIQINIARFPRFKELFPRMAGFDRICPRIFKPHYVKDMDYTKNQLVDQVPGAFFLVRRTCFEQLGGFDERFFMYYEDVDFSYRAHLAGWKTQYLADVKVIHGGGGTTESIKDIRLFYSLRSRVLYAGKHFGRRQALAVIFGIITLEFPTRFARAVLRLSLGELTATLKGFRLYMRYLPEALKRL